MELREKSKSCMSITSSGAGPPPYNKDALPNQQPASRHRPSSLASLIPSSNAATYGGGNNATDIILATSFTHTQTPVVQNHLHQDDQFHLLPRTQRSNPDPDPNHPSSPPLITAETSATARYRECLKNHAASIGGHVMDGCGEFMPGGEEGTPEAFKCAACYCHRSFHRREVLGEPPNHSNYHYPHNHSNPIRNNSSIRRNDKMQPPPSPPPPRPHHHHQIQSDQHPPGYPHAARPFPQSTVMTFGGEGGAAESSSEDLNLYQEVVHQHSLQHAHPTSKKRFRSKFTAEQKDKMMEFANTLGWKIQKQDEQQVKQFCVELAIKRQAFKVWMHNNKQAMRKKQS